MCGLAVEPGEEVVEVGGGEFPFEWSCGLVVADLESGQPVGDGVEVIEVVGREHFPLHNGEVDLDLIQP